MADAEAPRGLLVLTRRIGESIVLVDHGEEARRGSSAGEVIGTIHVVDVRDGPGSKVRVGLQMPEHIGCYRSEVWAAIMRGEPSPREAGR